MWREQVADYLSRNWYIYPFLDPRHREVVLDFIDGFLAHVEFLVSPTLEDPEALSWLVGANAALVGGAQATACFADVRWVYLLDDGLLEEDKSGDALGHSTVRINALDLLEESRQRIPGQQIAIHEFAHVLDALFGISDSTEGLRQGLDIHLENRRAGIDDGIPDEVVRVLIEEDSSIEFFAYVSELFFTDPHGVIEFHPPLYQDLVGIFGLDPASWLPDLALAGEAAQD